jgi:rod shape determining protein RodA
MAQSTSGLQNKGIDWIMIALYLSLVAIGYMMVYSSYYDGKNTFVFLDFSTEMGKQTVWLIISLLIFIGVLTIEWNFWNVIALPMYGISLLFLILVLFFGTVRNGNKSWFDLGFMSFQPSELAKLTTCLAVASYMSFNKNNLKNNKVLFTAIALFAVPMALVLLQPDAGSALVFLSFFVLLYRKGLSPILYIIAFLLIAIFIISLSFSASGITIATLLIAGAILLVTVDTSIKNVALSFIMLVAGIWAHIKGYSIPVIIVSSLFVAYTSWFSYKNRNMRTLTLVLVASALTIVLTFTTQFLFNSVLKPHQQERINIWLRPEKCDPRGALYNLIQSKLAIGSGGFTGKGYLNGEMTKLNYVPEQSTDFIFSIVGEEQGFVGTAGVIILYMLLIIRSITIAERAHLEFVRNYAYCIAGIFFLHFFVNIGMTMGLMPIIGIPLPLLSRGGTSLLIFTIMLGILIKMDTARFRIA